MTVAWFGYDAPPEIMFDAAHQKFADAAAPALDQFQEGLRVTHEGPPSRNIVLGHSYGTTVVGDAASHGRTLDADMITFVASPGTTVDHATDLHLTGVPDGQQYLHVYSTKAAHDPVPLYPLVSGLIPGTDDFGRDPTDFMFGGQTFTSDPGTASYAAPAIASLVPGGLPLAAYLAANPYSGDAHSEYWNHNSKSLINIGYIITGDLEKVGYAE